MGKFSDMAQVPYIEHEKRMYKAYKRECLLKVMLAATNGLWLIAAILSFITR